MVKNFIKVGINYIDLAPLCSFRFIPDNKGYIKAYLYFLGRETPVLIKIKNRNELAELFIALDAYLDNTLKESLNKLIDEIDKMRREFKNNKDKT